jgi:UrcA family protein
MRTSGNVIVEPPEPSLWRTAPAVHPRVSGEFRILQRRAKDLAARPRDKADGTQPQEENMKTILAPFAAALALAAAPAPAQSDRTVGYGDLDLASARGQATLDTRVRGAVRQACGKPGSFDPIEWREIRRCRHAKGTEAQRGVEQAIARYELKAADRLAARR